MHTSCRWAAYVAVGVKLVTPGLHCAAACSQIMETCGFCWGKPQGLPQLCLNMRVDCTGVCSVERMAMAKAVAEACWAVCMGLQRRILFIVCSCLTLCSLAVHLSPYGGVLLGFFPLRHAQYPVFRKTCAPGSCLSKNGRNAA